MIEILFGVRNMNEFYAVLNENKAILNAIRIISMASVTYFTDDEKRFVNTRPAINEFYCVVTHDGVAYTCKGVNGPVGAIRINHIDTGVKYGL
jgi:hypothetical protein